MLTPEAYRSLLSLLCRSFTPKEFHRFVRTSATLGRPNNGASLVDELLPPEHSRPRVYFSEACDDLERFGLIPSLLEDMLRVRPLRAADIELVARKLGLDIDIAVARARAIIDLQPLGLDPGVSDEELRRRRLVDELDEALAERARQPADMMSGDFQRTRLAARITHLANEIRETFVARRGTRIAGTVLDTAMESGAFGQVWQSHLPHDPQRRMATKIFHLTQLTTGVQLRYFRRGCRAMEILDRARGVEDPAIVRLHAVSGDTLAFSMPFLPNGNLAAIASHRWSLETKLEKFRTICEALAFAHRHNVIHRDISPYNVVLDAHDIPMIADFDIADSRRFSHLSIHGRMGAQGFAAPEQWHAHGDIDHRVDIYSLGRLLTFMLLEREFDAGMTPRQALRCTPRIPPALIEVLMCACDPNPNNRFDALEELLCALDRNDMTMRGLPPASRARGALWLAVPVALQVVLVGSALQRLDGASSLHAAVATAPPPVNGPVPAPPPTPTTHKAPVEPEASDAGPKHLDEKSIYKHNFEPTTIKPRTPRTLTPPVVEPNLPKPPELAETTTLVDFETNPDLGEVLECATKAGGIVVQVDVKFHVESSGSPVVDNISPYNGNVAPCVKTRIELMRFPKTRQPSEALRWHHTFK